MRRKFGVLGAGCLALGVAMAGGFQHPLCVHVSPTGDDAGDGTVEHPLRSMKGARDFLRAFRAAHGGNNPYGGAVVEFADGVYPIDEPVAFEAQDSGTLVPYKGDDVRPIVYQAAHRGKARLVGSQPLTWAKIAAADPGYALLPEGTRGHVFTAVIPGTNTLAGFLGGGVDPLKETEHPISLFDGAQRLALSQYPKEGTMTVAKFFGEKHFHGSHVGHVSHDGVFEFDSPRMTAWAQEPELWAHGFWIFLWRDMKSRVIAVDPVQKRMAVDVHLRICEGFKDNVGTFRVFNALSEMDGPGQWVVDRARRRLYVWPESGSAAGLTAAMTRHLIHAQGLRDVTFDGLVFENSRDAAVLLEDCRSVTVRASTIRRSSSWGVRAVRGRDCRVVGCDLYDLGEGGVSVDGGDPRTLTAANHIVDNCHISHFGKIIANSRPGIYLLGVGCRATHNLIHHTLHTGILFKGNDHYVGYNVVHDTCMHNDDAGAIYCCQLDWTLRGSLVEYNFVHANGIQPRPSGTPGIYLDDFSSGTTVRGNIVSACSAGIWVCGGNDNLIERNLVFNVIDNGISLASRGIETFARPISSKGRDSKLYTKITSNGVFRSALWTNRYPHMLDVFKLEDGVFAHNALYNTFASNVIASTAIDFHKSNWEKVKDYNTFTDNLHEKGDPGFSVTSADFALKPGTAAHRLLGDTRFGAMGLYASADRATPAVKFGKGMRPLRKPSIYYRAAKAEVTLIVDGLPEGVETFGRDLVGCTAPDWTKGKRVVCAPGERLGSSWREYVFSFVPNADCTASFYLRGVHGEKTYYDDFSVEGADIGDGTFEDGGTGWQTRSGTAEDADFTEPLGVTGATRGVTPHGGAKMCAANMNATTSRTVSFKKDQKVTVRFFACAAE